MGSQRLASTPSPSQAEAPHVMTSQVLTVGSYTNYAPQEFLDPYTQQPVGFDVDLITAVAQKMHLQVHVVSYDFQSLIDGLTARHFDVVISAVGITPEAQRKADFVPYFRGGKTLLVAQGNPSHIHTLHDLCGLSAAVKDMTFEWHELLSMTDACHRDGKPAIKVQVVKQYSAAVQLLQNKQVVAAYEDASVADYAIKLHPTALELAGDMIGPTMEGIVVRKDDAVMLSAVQQALQSLEKDGTYHALIKKWGLYSGDVMVPANSNVPSN
ncbi:hypothetical protein KDA_19750 [Dictyobacter alpinus]|uniref:Solute-binding protein family 3/N-terminal domain-containing protein n=2 Tax=Dictyobacter alpinus TaxID=2014873 RepID=A0A402B565_9CHLR|nr:hypothetical protein KDA_19750 [Dictyobacter alpinus]